MMPVVEPDTSAERGGRMGDAYISSFPLYLKQRILTLIQFDFARCQVPVSWIFKKNPRTKSKREVVPNSRIRASSSIPTKPLVPNAKYILFRPPYSSCPSHLLAVSTPPHLPPFADTMPADTTDPPPLTTPPPAPPRPPQPAPPHQASSSPRGYPGRPSGYSSYSPHP